jgi:hypothetical protein
VTSAGNELIKAASVEGTRMILDTSCKTREEAKGRRTKSHRGVGKTRCRRVGSR